MKVYVLMGWLARHGISIDVQGVYASRRAAQKHIDNDRSRWSWRIVERKVRKAKRHHE